MTDEEVQKLGELKDYRLGIKTDFKFDAPESDKTRRLKKSQIPDGPPAFKEKFKKAWSAKEDTFTYDGVTYATDAFVREGTKVYDRSFVNMDEYAKQGLRERFSRGGAIVRLIRDFLKQDVKEGKVPSRNDLDKAITKTKTTYPNLVNKYTKESKTEADDLRMLENYAAGGGGKTTVDSILASVTKPATEFQEKTTPLVRKQKAYRSDMAKNTAATAVGTALIMEASEAVKDIYNDLNKTEREKFEAAFSKAHNAGKDTFMYKGEEYSTEVRKGKEHGGIMVMAMPPEFTGIPVDTYDNIPDDEKEAAEKSQLPDEEMETNYIEFVIDEALEEADQDYLMEILEQDNKLSNIFDQLMDVAAEFSGEGEVNGPGTGVSDSIPARLSDGEFVFTKKATDQIGADKLQMMMDNAERQFDEESRMKKAFGGITYDPATGKRNDRMTEDELTEEAIKQQMINSNRMPSVMR